jgi:tripartite ATP-independent transporter DctM subunit
MRARILNALALVNEAVVVMAIVLDLLLTFANTIARYGFNSGIHFAEDVSAILIGIITWLGSAAYFRRAGGMSYTALVDHTGGTAGAALRAAGLWLVLIVITISLWSFPLFFQRQLMQSLPVMGISNAAVVGWQAVGLTLFAVFAAEKLAATPWRSVAVAFGVLLLLAGAVLVLRELCDQGAEFDPLLPVAVVMVAAFLTGAPIAVILGLGGALFFIITGDAPLAAIPAAYQAGITSFILLAIPFFMLAGALMEVSGLARRMIDMVQEWIGHWPGGLLLAEVVAMYIFSGISGSKAADMATVGSVMKGPMRERGYPATESVAVLAAAAAMGEVIPPSLALLILGSITTLSVGALFLAGILPAGFLAIALMIAIVVKSRGGRMPKGPRFALRRALCSIPPSIPALLLPVIVVGSIVGGIASPTESSSFASVYGFIVAALVYRSISFGATWIALREAALTAGMILLMVAMANLLSQAIVIDGLGRTLALAFGALHDPTLFLFLSMAAMIVIGFVLEGFPAILISAPILLPVAERMGIDPLQYGILLVMAVGIGVFLPPVGIGYYIACAIGDAPTSKTMRPSLMYNVWLVFGLIVVMLVPAITLAVPHAFGFR